MWRLEARPPIPTELGTEEQAELILERTFVAECNEAMAQRYGYARPEDVVGVRLDDLWRESYEGKLAVVRRFIEAGYRADNLETQGRFPDGRPGFFLSSLAGLVTDGYLVGAWGVERDITERKQAEEALQESETRFRSAFDDAPHGMAITDPDSRLVQVNRALCRMLGYSETELVGKLSLEVTLPEDVGIGRAFLRRLYAEADETLGSGEAVCDQGGPRDLGRLDRQSPSDAGRRSAPPPQPHTGYHRTETKSGRAARERSALPPVHAVESGGDLEIGT